MEYTITLESMTALNSKSQKFKGQVSRFAEENLGVGVTFEDFEKWLNQHGCRLVETDKQWKAVFSSILSNHVQYELRYEHDSSNKLVTVFNLKKML